MARRRRPAPSSGGLGLPGQFLDAEAVAEVAERLAGLALGLEAGEDRRQLGGDAVVGDVVLVEDVEPVAEGAAAEEDGVGAGRRGAVVGLDGRAADQAYVGVIGAGAA